MDKSGNQEREVRAARNQSMFRALNEKLATLNEAFETVTGALAIACECADPTCVEMLEIRSEEYEAVREQPRRFVVCRGHVYPDVEGIVGENDGFVVVEKFAAAGDEAEMLA